MKTAEFTNGWIIIYTAAGSLARITTLQAMPSPNFLVYGAKRSDSSLGE